LSDTRLQLRLAYCANSCRAHLNRCGTPKTRNRTRYRRRPAWGSGEVRRAFKPALLFSYANAVAGKLLRVPTYIPYRRAWILLMQSQGCGRAKSAQSGRVSPDGGPFLALRRKALPPSALRALGIGN